MESAKNGIRIPENCMTTKKPDYRTAAVTEETPLLVHVRMLDETDFWIRREQLTAPEPKSRE